MFIFFNSIYLLKAWCHIRRKGRSWTVWVTITHQSAPFTLLFWLWIMLKVANKGYNCDLSEDFKSLQLNKFKVVLLYIFKHWLCYIFEKRSRFNQFWLYGGIYVYRGQCFVIFYIHYLVSWKCASLKNVEQWHTNILLNSEFSYCLINVNIMNLVIAWSMSTQWI